MARESTARADWVGFRVNGAQTAAELEAIRMSVERSRPFGGEAWVKRTAADMGLESTLRRRGRAEQETGLKKGSRHLFFPFLSEFTSHKRPPRGELVRSR